jgi:hypothetical protein
MMIETWSSAHFSLFCDYGDDEGLIIEKYLKKNNHIERTIQFRFVLAM